MSIISPETTPFADLDHPADSGVGRVLIGQEQDPNCLNGSEDDDVIVGGAQADLLDGGLGDDTILGGAGDDLIYGGPGNDDLQGNLGNDVINAGAGDDDLQGGDGNDILRGDFGDDDLQGGAGSDKLIGGAGSDRLEGGDGADSLEGGAGADVFVFDTADSGVDIVRDYNAFVDSIEILGTSDPVKYDAATGSVFDSNGKELFKLQKGLDVNNIQSNVDFELF